MLNIAICDDDIQTTGRMDMLLQEIAKRNFMDVEIEVFWNGSVIREAEIITLIVGIITLCFALWEKEIK